MARWHCCNVLHVGPDTRRVWQFDSRNGDFSLNREQSVAAGESLPSSLVTKSWRSLWQRKLNVAWLPPESVFLRVAQLPKASFEETVSMVELQLEKLSPIPVTQVVWSIHVLPDHTGVTGRAGSPLPAAPAEKSDDAHGVTRPADEAQAANLQTVIVLLAEREAVEEFLGQLEGQGYLADRLEVPALDQLQATAISGDGAWIYPEAVGGHNNALVAWWYGGTLQNLNLLSLPVEGDRAAAVKDQIAQVAWAGELEGWLLSSPAWHLVADETLAAEWEPILRQALEEPIRIVAPVQPGQLAAFTARRAAVADPKSNLLPAEFSTRYQQQFVDRLWLRGLFAVGGIYLVGVAVYALALMGFNWQTQRVERRVAAISATYTNAIQIKERFNILKDRQALKFAALDCWKAVAEVMPNEITLDSLNFSDGHKLTLNGTAPSGQDRAVLDFYDGLRKAQAGGEPLFDPKKGDATPRYGTGPGGTLAWSFNLELKRTDIR